MLGAAARGGLVGHRGHPLDQASFVEGTNAHQHAAHGAIAANPVAATFCQCVLDDGQIHRVQNDDGAVVHPQCGCGVNPVTSPPCGAQFGEYLGGVVAALGCDDDVALFQCGNIHGVFERGLVFCLRRGFATGVGGREKHGLDQAKIAFGLHAVHENGPDHATPADKPYYVTNFHHITPFQTGNTKDFSCPARLAGEGVTNRAVSAFNGCRFGGRHAHNLFPPFHAGRVLEGKGQVAMHGLIVNDTFTVP